MTSPGQSRRSLASPRLRCVPTKTGDGLSKLSSTSEKSARDLPRTCNRRDGSVRHAAANAARWAARHTVRHRGARRARAGYRRARHRCRVAARAALYGIPAVPTEGGRRSHLPNGIPRRLRRQKSLRLRAHVRSAPRQHHARAVAPRSARTIGPDQAPHRLLQRQTQRLRARCEPRRCEARLCDEQRRQRGRVVERHLGRGHPGGLARLDRRVPHSALAASLPEVDDHLRLRHLARHRATRGAIELAALVADEERTLVAARPARRSLGTLGGATR